jgi:hypothetical protein
MYVLPEELPVLEHHGHHASLRPPPITMILHGFMVSHRFLHLDVGELEPDAFSVICWPEPDMHRSTLVAYLSVVFIVLGDDGVTAHIYRRKP